MDGWRIVSSETQFRNAHVELATVEVESPTRPEPRKWTVARRKSAVVVAAMNEAGELMLIRQERIPICAAIWEVPAGQIDQPGALSEPEIETIALRELREETGFELPGGTALVALGDYFSSPGFTDEHGYFFLARPVRPAEAGPARDEAEAILECRFFSPREVNRMIAENEIRDANTLSIWARLVARRLIALPLS